MISSYSYPPGWKVVPLGQLVTSVQSGFASGARDPNGVIQLRMNNVTTDGSLDWTSFIRVPTSQEQLDKYRLCPGDVLFNSTNSPELVGKSVTFDGYAEPVVFSNHFLRLRVDEARLDPWYLGRWLTKQWQRRVFQNVCTRWVNQAAVRKDDLLSLKVPLPPLPEQKRIAVILAKADRLRRLRRYARELSDTYLQSMFLEMFGDPMTNPMRWERTTIGEVVASSQYGTSKKSHSEEKGYPVLGMGNITYSGGIDLTSLSHVELSEEEFEALRLVPGDIIFNRTNSTELIGKTAHWNLELDAVLASYLVKLKLKRKVLPDYFAALLNTRHYKRLFQERCKKAVGQSNISPTLLKEFPMLVPPLPLQQGFYEVIRKFERLRAQQREAERQAEHLFQTLLHRAFQGGKL